MVEIRTEKTEDHEAIYRLHDAAFKNKDQESRLVEKIRGSERYIPDLSIVAVEANQVIGHALFSLADVVNEVNPFEVIVLAPIAVLPGHQRKGIGGQLIREGLRRCTERGFSHVFLIGHPSYYPQFGFTPARRLGFELKQFPVSDEVFMVHVLKPGEGEARGMTGELLYPATFF